MFLFLIATGWCSTLDTQFRMRRVKELSEIFFFASVRFEYGVILAFTLGGSSFSRLIARSLYGGNSQVRTARLRDAFLMRERPLHELIRQSNFNVIQFHSFWLILDIFFKFSRRPSRFLKQNWPHDHRDHDCEDTLKSTTIKIQLDAIID